MALAVCVQLPLRLRILILICCTKKDLLTLGGAVLSLWSAWTSTDPQFNIFNDNEVVIIHKLTAQHLLCAETDDSIMKSARFLHPNGRKRGSHNTFDTIRNDRCSGCYDNTFSS